MQNGRMEGGLVKARVWGRGGAIVGRRSGRGVRWGVGRRHFSWRVVCRAWRSGWQHLAAAELSVCIGVELAQDGGGGGDFGGGEPAIVIGVKQGQRGLRAALSGFEVVAPGGAVVLIGAGAILNWGGVERGADSAGGQDAQKLKNGKVCAGTAEKVGLGPDGIHWILGPI